MKYAVYVNGNVVFSANSKYECIAYGTILLSKELDKIKSSGDENMKANLLDKICSFTYNARKIDGIGFYADCQLNDMDIEVKAFTEKTYEVIYKVTFEKDVIPNEDFFASEHRVLCYENKVDDIVKQFRKKLERNVYDDLSVRGEAFDDMLGKEIECLQDEETAYDVLDTIHKKYHTIVVNEVKMN